MATITFPSNTTEITDSIRTAIGRTIYLQIVASSIPCSVCTLDPVTNTSTDSFCYNCSGTFWIEQEEEYPVLAHVNWGPGDILQWNTGGQYFDGDCLVQIKLTEENLNAVDTTNYVVVDERELEIKSKILRGVPELNRILLNLVERSK